jgi:hypothetical protein
MKDLLWFVPVGVIMVTALYRFVRGLGPRRELTSQEEGEATSVAIVAQDLHHP